MAYEYNHKILDPLTLRPDLIYAKKCAFHKLSSKIFIFIYYITFSIIDLSNLEDHFEAAVFDQRPLNHVLRFVLKRWVK